MHLGVNSDIVSPQNKEPTLFDLTKEDPFVRWCPKCQEAGRRIKLHLCQINVDDAMFLCMEDQCTYPFSEEDVEFCMIRRSLSQMMSGLSKDLCHPIPDFGRPKPRKIKKCKVAQTNTLPPQNVESGSLMLSSARDADDGDLFGSSFWDSIASSDMLNVADDQNFLTNIDTSIFNEEINWNDNDLNDISNGLDSLLSNLTTETLNTKPNANSDSLTVLLDQNFDCSVTTNASDLSYVPAPDDDTLRNFSNYDTSAKSVVAYSNSYSDEQNSSLRAVCQVSQAALEELKPCTSKHNAMVQWQNENSLCWLDVILHCIVNCTSIRIYLKSRMNSSSLSSNHFYKLCSAFDYVQQKYNLTLMDTISDKKSISQEQTSCSLMLNEIRKEFCDILQSKFSLKQGVDQSVHEMFSNVLALDARVRDLFSVQVRWEFECEECKLRRVKRSSTTVISFPSVSQSFHPLHADFETPCFSCSSQQQSMSMVLEVVPPCLMMHFQQGVPHNHFNAFDFAIEDHLYCVTAVIQYLTQPFNHFVVWIRNSKKNLWMCCDDLKDATCVWRKGAPKIPSKQVHMMMWERQCRAATAESYEQFLTAFLKTIYNEDALLSGDEFPPEILGGSDAADYGDSFPWSTFNRDTGNCMKLEVLRSNCRMLGTQLDCKADFNESGGGNSWPSLQQAGFDAVSASRSFTSQSLPLMRYPLQYYLCSKKRDNGVLRMKVANAVIDLTATSNNPMKKTSARNSFDNPSRDKSKITGKRKSFAGNNCDVGSMPKQKAQRSASTSFVGECVVKEKRELDLSKNDVADTDDTEKNTNCQDLNDQHVAESARNKPVKSSETVSDVRKSARKKKPEALTDMVNISSLSEEVPLKNEVETFSDPCKVEHSKAAQPLSDIDTEKIDRFLNDEDHTGCDSDMDIEMLALACEELKTLPPSPLSNASDSACESETFTDVPILTQTCDQLKSLPLSPLSNSSDNTFSSSDAPIAPVPHFNGNCTLAPINSASAILTRNSIVVRKTSVLTTPNGFSDFDKMPPDRFRANSKLFSYSAFGVTKPKSSFRLSDRKKAQLKLIKAESSQTPQFY